MKKLFILALVCLILSSCAKDVLPTEVERFSSYSSIEPERGFAKLIHVNGRYYYEVGESKYGVRCGMMDGKVIADQTPKDPYGIPKGDNEANFGMAKPEYGYQRGVSRAELELLDDDGWYTYKAIPGNINVERFKYVYTLGKDEKWLIFSGLWFDYEQIKSSLENREAGETKSFAFVKI